MTITGVDDLAADGPVTYNIVTAAATSTDPNYTGRNAANVSVTNQDNDTAGTTVNPTSGLVTTELGGTATFTVVLNTLPGATVTINLSSSLPAEATVSPAILTFTTANWNVVQTVTVTGVADLLDDGDKSFTINTSAAISTDTVYNNRVVSDVTGINQNKDFRPVAVNDIYQTNARPDKPLNIGAPGVLKNDTDANNDPLTVSLQSGTAIGNLALSINGSFVYTPHAAAATLQTDTFTYFAHDGKDSSLLTATVTIVIDPILPTVNWAGDLTNGEILEVVDKFMQLTAAPTDNYSVSQVRFFRWDAVNNKYVDIGVVNSSPYVLNLDTTSLNFHWNQVFITARDGAGNTSPYQFIWVYRNLPFQLFLPRVAR